MKRLLCPQIPSPSRSVPLNATEANHATRVLRLGPGDLIEALDGSGKSVLAKLQNRGGSIWLEYAGEGTLKHTENPTGPEIILELAILKGDAMEWVIEKAVELGVHQIIPVMTAHTVVQVKHKGPQAFQERWQKIADQALKQCGRLQRMQVALPISLEALMIEPRRLLPALRLWADEASRKQALPLLIALGAQTPPLKEIRILIGPEGGWSQSEREFLTKESSGPMVPVSLGPLVLRAETAAIYSISLISGTFFTQPVSPRFP